MKTRLLIFIFALALAVAEGWWLRQSRVPAPAPLAVAAHSGPVGPKRIVITPPAPVQPVAGALPAELSKTIMDIASLIQSGDLVTVMRMYMPPEQLADLPPDTLAQLDQIKQQLANLLTLQQKLQSMSQLFAALKDQTPEMSADGGTATFQLTMPDEARRLDPTHATTQPVTFQKINGDWYVMDFDGL